MKKSIFEIIGLPNPFGVLLLSFLFILLLAPYLSGSDFGLFKVPVFSEEAKKWLKIIGPALFLIGVLSFVPLLETGKAGTTDYGVRVTDADSRRAIARAKVTVATHGILLRGETDEDGLYVMKINSAIAPESLVNVRVEAPNYNISQSDLPFRPLQDVALTSSATARNIPNSQIIRPAFEATPEIRPRKDRQTPTVTPAINTNTGSQQPDLILNIDGNSSLQDLQLRLEVEEANQLSEVVNITTVVVDNLQVNRAFLVRARIDASLGRLTLVEVPNEQALSSEVAKQVNLGKKFIFSSDIYADGRVIKVAAFR